MNIRKGIYAVLFMLLLVAYLWVYAISEGQKKLYKNYQSQQYNLLFESNIDLLDEDDVEVLNISKKLSIYDTISSKVSTQREKAEQKQRNISNIINSLEDALVSLDLEIALANKKIRTINSDIIDIKGNIELTSQEMNELKVKIAESNQVLLDYMVYIYKRWNTLSSGEEEIDNLKAILLNGEDMSDVIDDLYYKSIAQLAGANIVAEHRKLVKDLYAKRIRLQRDEKSLKVLRKSEIIEKGILRDKQIFKERLLEASKWRQSEYEKFIKQKVDLERSLNIKSVEQKIKFKNIQKNLLDKHDCEFIDLSKDDVETRNLSKKCLNLNKIIFSETKLKDLKQLEWSLFSWPIIPSRWISAYFKDGSYRAEFWVDHNAIDIPADQSTPIRAPMDGYVLFIEPPTDTGYSFVAIKHAQWFVSVYGHTSEVLVDQYDFIEKWQVFARSGGEYGTPGAGFLTTGPHLHFELFRDKKYIDPMNFLDISILPFSEIDDRYRYKYYSDFKARKWYDYKEQEDDKKRRFSIEWGNEIERQQYLLNKYARSDFRDWNMWVSQSLDGWIDPTFVMCIGLAESSLWVNLTTDYNVWNVWNTDGGDRVAYPNPRSWVYSIVRTLNNRFLGRYNTIDKLSCYWNSEAKLCDRSKPVGEFVYASSSDHWHNNIIKCMSHVKGIYVPDDYGFRLN